MFGWQLAARQHKPELTYVSFTHKICIATTRTAPETPGDNFFDDVLTDAEGKLLTISEHGEVKSQYVLPVEVTQSQLRDAITQRRDSQIISKK